MGTRVVELVKNTVITLILFLIANILTSVISLYLLRLSPNIRIVDLKVVFDPLITIAYLMVFYFLNSIYQPNQQSINKLFVLTLFLSFAMDFFKGAIFINIMFFLLRKTRLI